MSPEAILFAVIPAAAGALLGACAWSLVARRTGVRDRFEWPEHALMSLTALVGVVVVLMLGHIVTRGVLFANPFAVPLLAAALVATWARRRRPQPRLSRVPRVPLVLAGGLLALLFLTPAAAGGSGVRTGDPPWHLGWTEQLLAGEPVPTGPAPEFGRNAYPWGFHALLATLTRLVPGSDPVTAHDAVHVLLLAAIPLSAACLARGIDRRAGWVAAAAASVIGGFGWVAAGAPEFFTSPSRGRFGADLVVASPNSVYELLPPAFPREVGLALVGAAGVMLLAARASDSRRAFGAAGIVVGLVGLVSLPMFVTALAWTLVALALSRASLSLAGLTLLLAAGVFGLWGAPVALAYLRHGGFVNVTPQLGVEWPLPTALSAWGLLLPLALGGILLAARGSARSARLLLGFGVASMLLLGAALLRGRYDWDLAGHATLLHQGRVWPPAHLLAAAFGGLALLRVWSWLLGVSRKVAIVAVALLLGTAAVSVGFASIALTRIASEHRGGFAFGRPDLERGSFVRRAADHLSPDDVLRVEDSRLLAFLSFSFSGVRLATYDDPRLAGNDLRIRYRDLAESWNERMRSGGFEATWEIVPSEDAGSRPAVESGDFNGRRWVLVRPD